MPPYALTKGIGERVGHVMDRADELNASVAIAVVDGGGHLVAFLRSFNAKPISCTTATGKARCAIMFSRDSSTTENMAKGNPIAFQSFASAAEMPFVIGSGGYFIEEKSVRLGIGVAGASPRLDDMIGELIREELSRLLEQTLSVEGPF